MSGWEPTSMRMCSACRGDYENPDGSTAVEPSELEDDEEGKSPDEGFPGRREQL